MMATFEITRVNYGGHQSLCSRLTRKWLESSRAWPKVNRIWGVPWCMYSTSLRSIPWALCLEMCGHHESVTGGQADGWTSGWMDGQAYSYVNGVYDIKYICHHRVRLWFVTQLPSNYCSVKCWSLRGADIMTACAKLPNCMSLTSWPE